MTDLLSRLAGEWPALLAVVVLIVGHLYFAIVEGQRLRPIGIPLFAAAAVFILAELYRTYR